MGCGNEEKRTEPAENKAYLELPFVLQELPPSWAARYGWSLSKSDVPTEGETQAVTALPLEVTAQKRGEMPWLEGLEAEQDEGSSAIQGRTLFKSTLHNLESSVSEPISSVAKWK